MKTKLVLSAILLASAAASPLRAASFTEAEFTRLFNEVKVLKSNVAPRDAVVGGQIDAVTSVATGEDSRAEMRFPDKSLTRLGANSRFTLRGDKRTLELDEGVMLLQVPKKMGGAKVRTAAVTAAVTGTTVLFEYVKGGFVKLIVIEGSVDLYFNDKPGVFKTVNAGEMIIMQVDSNFIPDPVDVDLNLLLRTSKLISADDVGTPNLKQVAEAAKEQSSKLKKGELVKTNLMIPGRGTQVAIMTNTRMNLAVASDGTQSQNGGQSSGNNNNNNNGGNGNGGPSAGSQVPTPLSPLISGTTVLNETSEVRTNPHVDAFNSVNGFGTYEGAVYNAAVPYSQFAFGINTPLVNPDAENVLAAGAPWAAFKFEELLINGTPFFNIADGGIRNIIFSAAGNIRLVEDDSFGFEAGGVGTSGEYYSNGWDLTGSGVENLVLYTQLGSIFIGPNFAFYGEYDDPFTNLSLIAADTGGDVNIQSDIDLRFYSGEGGYSEGGSLVVSAGQDIIMGSAVSSFDIYAEGYRTISASSVSATAGRDITIQSTEVRTDKRATFTAGRSIRIDNSSVLRVLSSDPDALLQLVAGQDVTIDGTDNYYETLDARNIEIESRNGNITLNGVRNFGTEVFKAQALGANGWITIGNSSLNANQVMKLYAQGNNGGVRFVENTNLFAGRTDIAGRTVEIANGKVVTIENGGSSLNVYTDNPQFNTSTRNVGKGTFNDSSDAGGNVIDVQHRSFNSRSQY